MWESQMSVAAVYKASYVSDGTKCFHWQRLHVDYYRLKYSGVEIYPIAVMSISTLSPRFAYTVITALIWTLRVMLIDNVTIPRAYKKRNVHGEI
jgi:hypothetical protein